MICDAYNYFNLSALVDSEIISVVAIANYKFLLAMLRNYCNAQCHTRVLITVVKIFKRATRILVKVISHKQRNDLNTYTSPEATKIQKMKPIRISKLGKV